VKHRVGIDVGGTFTDFVRVAEDGSGFTVLKVPTTPGDPARGLHEGLRALFERDRLAPRDVTYLGHGTTVCLNAVLEKTGARTALCNLRGA